MRDTLRDYGGDGDGGRDRASGSSRLDQGIVADLMDMGSSLHASGIMEAASSNPASKDAVAAGVDKPELEN